MSHLTPPHPPLRVMVELARLRAVILKRTEWFSPHSIGSAFTEKLMHKSWPRRAFSVVLGTLATLGCAPTHVTRCSDAIDTNSPVLSNGFAFNLSNTGNNRSQI